MRRRDLLATVGAFGGLSTAGCVGDDPSTTTPDDPGSADDPSTTTHDDPGSTDGGTEDGDRVTDDPVETITVGDRDGVPFPENNGPHGVHVVNDADRTRELALELTRAETTVLDRVVAVPARRRVAVTLNEPGEYTLTLGLDGDVADAVTVGRARFDCNASTTTVTVDETGRVDTTTTSTMLACHGPMVVDTRFEQGEGACGSTDRASVTTDGERLQVSGAVRTPDPCHDLALSGVELVDADEYGGRSGTLVVRVATDGQQDGACVNCVGEVPYEVSVEMAHAHPGRVRVVHAGDDDRTVTETTPE